MTLHRFTPQKESWYPWTGGWVGTRVSLGVSCPFRISNLGTVQTGAYSLYWLSFPTLHYCKTSAMWRVIIKIKTVEISLLWIPGIKFYQNSYAVYVRQYMAGQSFLCLYCRSPYERTNRGSEWSDNAFSGASELGVSVAWKVVKTIMQYCNSNINAYT